MSRFSADEEELLRRLGPWAPLAWVPWLQQIHAAEPVAGSVLAALCGVQIPAVEVAELDPQNQRPECQVCWRLWAVVRTRREPRSPRTC